MGGLSTPYVNFITGVLNVVGKIYSKMLAFPTKLHGITSTLVNIYVCTVSKELSLLIRYDSYKIDDSETDSPGQHVNQLLLTEPHSKFNTRIFFII